MPKRKHPDISPHWRKLMKLIPGYDPIATAPPGYWFDEERAEKAIEVFQGDDDGPGLLYHVKAFTGPFYLEPWQQAVTGCIFGWRTPENLRRYREVWFYVPRKNGKTPWAGGIVVVVLMTDEEPGIEAYSAASDRDQAALVYNYVHGMILTEPILKERLKVYTALKSIEYQEKFHSYKVLSGIPESKHGLNVHLGIIDETHAHKTPDLMDVIMTGTAARKQPLIIHTTTADFMRESVCNEKYEYACKVRDRVIDDPAFLPVIYEAKEPEDEEKDPLWWTKEKVWKQANPNYGVSVEPDYIKRECQRALDSPRLRNTFKRLHLNIRTGQENAWFGIEKWDACYDSDLSPEDLEGKPCFAGLDLASVSDLCALALWFPDDHAVLTWFWLPEETARERFEKASVPYPQWIDEGHIIATEGNVADYDRIRRMISGVDTFGKKHDDCLVNQYHIRELAIDRWNANQITTQLMGDGIEVIPFGQGFASMSAPSKELERLITAQSLRHNGNPVMRWMASHIAIDQDAAGNIKPSKKHSNEKIDGFSALIMSIGRAIIDEGEEGPSIYEKRGVITI